MRELNLGGVSHAVIVAPHSDDETIAALYVIRALRAQGSRVDVIVATDGAASHRVSRTHPKERRVAMRRAETLCAMAMVGVPRNRVEFLDLPDGGTRSLDLATTRRALRQMRMRSAPDLVVEPSPWDDHPDHREVAKFCALAWPPRIRRLRYIVWPQAGAPNISRAKQVGLYGPANLKRAAIGRYRSQLGVIRDDPQGFALTHKMVQRMSAPRELFSA